MVSCNEFSQMNRRFFLKFSALLAASGTAPAQIAPVPSRRRPLRVLIAGGGLSGLCAAYRLQQQGAQVQVLEAQLRPGGRVQTLRDPFTPGLHAEAGAARVPDNHTLTNQYLKEFGLALEPFVSANKDTLYYLNGKRIRLNADSVQEWPLPLTDAEKRLSLNALVEKYITPIVSKYGDLPAGGRLPDGFEALDRFSEGEMLRRQGASPAAIKLLLLGFDPELGSAAWWMLEELGLRITKSYGRIIGGNDRLPRAFAERLPDRIRYGCKVISIQQDERQVTAVIERGGERETYEADRLICTLPFSVAAPVLREARLPADKMKAIQETGYTPVTKTFLQCQSRFWLSENLSGFANSDLPIERIWAGPGEDPHDRGILHTYLMGSKATAVDKMTEDERQRFTINEAKKIFPSVADQYEGGTSKCWALDPWQKGAYAQFDVGQIHFIPLNGRQEGRIHFAGEHTSNWGGWMQGALDSAHRVVNEINATG